MAYRPVKPVPTATAARSGPTSSTSMAIPAALTMGWRRLGISTPGPSPIREVRAALQASIAHTSGYRAGESYSQARS